MNIAAWVLVVMFALRPLDAAATLYARRRLEDPARLDAFLRQSMSKAYAVGYLVMAFAVSAASIVLLLRAVGVL